MEDDPGGLWSYGFKKCFNKDLQWFILAVLRQSDLRHFQSINMLLIAKSSPADLWVYMDQCRYVGIDLVEFNEMMDVISVKHDLLRREAPQRYANIAVTPSLRISMWTWQKIRSVFCRLQTQG